MWYYNIISVFVNAKILLNIYTENFCNSAKLRNSDTIDFILGIIKLYKKKSCI